MDHEYEHSTIVAMEQQLASERKLRESLVKEERTFQADYAEKVREGEQAMARIAGKEAERLAGEIETLDAQIADLEDRIEQSEANNSTDAILDWWTEFSAAIRGEVVNAEAVLNANQALKERFAAIFVRSPKNGTVRFDFVLRERPPGAPLVASRLWVDDPENLPEDGVLIDFVSEDAGGDQAVANRPGGHWSG